MNCNTLFFFNIILQKVISLSDGLWHETCTKVEKVHFYLYKFHNFIPEGKIDTKQFRKIYIYIYIYIYMYKCRNKIKIEMNHFNSNEILFNVC